MPINFSGGEINFKLGDATRGIGSQTSGGPLSSPALKDANQFSNAFNQGQTPLTTPLQQMCEKINNVAYIEGGNIATAAMASRQNLSGISAKSFNVGERTFDGFALGR